MTDRNTHTDEDLDNEASRYDTAEGWQPADPYQKQREKIREQMHRNFNYESMLQTLPANEWRFRRQENAAPSRPLYKDLWCEGEVAVLFGPKSSAKSVLAVQLGDSIARDSAFVGTRASLPASSLTHPSPVIPQPVLYIDCQRSRAQWHERYSSQPFPRDPRRVHHRFPRNFRRAALDWDGTVPDEFKGNLGEFLRHSIMQEIDRSGARIVILDDLTAFCGGSTTPLAVTKAIRLLKLLSVTNNLSILALHTPSNDPMRPARSQVACQPPTAYRQPSRIYDAADTVFTIAPSTFAPDIRYVKHLTSPRPITHDHTNVLTYRLERTTSPAGNPGIPACNASSGNAGIPACNAPPGNAGILACNAPPGNAGIPACNASPREADTSPATEPIESTESALIHVNPHSAIRTPQSEGPFLALTSLGPSEERDHHRDYAAEARQAQLAHERELKRLWRRSSKDILVDAVIDGSYARYLKGD